MSEENVEIVRAGIGRVQPARRGACSQRVIQRLKTFRPAILARVPTATTGFRRCLRGLLRRKPGPWEESPYEFELIEVGNNKIVTHVRAQMRAQGSGRRGQRGASGMWCTFRNGKVLRFECFADRAEALEAAGLSE